MNFEDTDDWPSLETVHEIGLTELLMVYKHSGNKNHKEDARPFYLAPDPYNDWIVVPDGWYVDTDSDDWLCEVTGSTTYLFKHKGVIYEIKVRTEEEGNFYQGGVYKGIYYLKSIKALLPKERWEIEPVEQTGRGWHSFKFKPYDPGLNTQGDIPYDTTFNEGTLNETKEYFKEVLYSIKTNRINEIKSEKLTVPHLKYSLEFTLEMKW